MIGLVPGSSRMPERAFLFADSSMISDHRNYFISKLIVSLDNMCTSNTGSIYSACFIVENGNIRLFCHTMSRKIQFACDNALCIQTSINNKKLSIPLCFHHCIKSLMKVYYRETMGESGIKYEHGFSIFFL